MLRPLWVVLALICLLAPKTTLADENTASAPTAARAKPEQIWKSGYTYYNRPGANLTLLDADLFYCADLVDNMPTMHGFHQNAYEGVGTLLGNYEYLGIGRTDIENCMIFRGWRLVAVEQDEGAKLYSLPTPQLNDWISNWVGSNDVHGVVVRTFTNVTMKQPSGLVAIWPYPSSHSLSMQRFDRSSLPKPHDSPPPPLYWSIKFEKALRPEQISEQSPDRAIFVVRVVRKKSQYGRGIIFIRTNDPSDQDKDPNRQTDKFLIKIPNNEDYDAISVFSGLPGNWYISGMLGVSACLSAPHFTAVPGKVYFLGSFTLSDDIKFDPNLELGRRLAPEQVAGKLEPADWHNGMQFPCDGTYINGLRFPEMASDTAPASRANAGDDGVKATTPTPDLAQKQ